MKIATQLQRLGACSDAIVWAEAYGDDRERAWQECRRGDWMLWLLGPDRGGDAQFARCAVACARLALRYTQDPAVKACLDAVSGWARGRLSLYELQELRDAAYWVADASRGFIAAAYAADAAWSAADVALVPVNSAWALADDAAGAAAYAAIAAEAAVHASYQGTDYHAVAVAGAAARERIVARAAVLVRKYYPQPPLVAAYRRRR